MLFYRKIVSNHEDSIMLLQASYNRSPASCVRVLCCSSNEVRTSTERHRSIEFRETVSNFIGFFNFAIILG